MIKLFRILRLCLEFLDDSKNYQLRDKLAELIKTFPIEKLDSFPANANPFICDAFHMGTQLDDQLVIMYSSHSKNNYLIMIHRPTGKRFKLDLSQLFNLD